MNDIASERIGPMLNPPYLDELIREDINDVGWNVMETASRLGCECGMIGGCGTSHEGIARMIEADAIGTIGSG